MAKSMLKSLVSESSAKDYQEFRKGVVSLLEVKGEIEEEITALLAIGGIVAEEAAEEKKGFLEGLNDFIKDIKESMSRPELKNARLIHFLESICDDPRMQEEMLTSILSARTVKENQK